MKVYPNFKWQHYWCRKKYNAKKSGIDFSLTVEEKLKLIESFPADGHPSYTGYQLGRLDHNKGYSFDNVEWQIGIDNRREANTRRDYIEKRWGNKWQEPVG